MILGLDLYSFIARQEGESYSISTPFMMQTHYNMVSEVEVTAISD